MCPSTDTSIAYLHSKSVQRLLDWPSNYVANSPTLAPPAKIPAEVLSFTVDQRAYNAYTRQFKTAVDTYLQGDYQLFLDSKVGMENLIAKSNIGHMEHRMWEYFWYRVFIPENAKWEAHLRDLALPSWESIVSEMYKAIVQRVEGADRLTRKLCAGRKTSGLHWDDKSGHIVSFDSDIV
ncbi:hypothetical protein EYZ11_007090 [Aspergillus tanneri]|uniref:Uncharacterized protein n=1 Tax=Aspergillus tanneri TaxID=1220188 RepID=A0A4S3JJF8_9EURO|nr:hypothetical protein EYZ11_007090 [Aspergillus tanneri]